VELAPLRTLPRFVDKVWAGGLLPSWADYSSWTLPPGTGEVWLVSDVEGAPSPLAAGGDLRELIERDPEAFLGERELAAQRARGETPRFPYLIKLLDIGEPLSVQVHPDAATARALDDGERGKSEAWLILEAGDDARVFAGAPEGSTPEALIAAAQSGSLGRALDSFRPEPGEGFPILPGTLHTARELLVLEAQETSDVTYRVFDWGRGRELHLEQAREVLERLGAGGRPPLAGPWRSGQRELAPGCPFRFEAAELPRGVTLPLPAGEGPGVLIGLAGACELILRDESEQTWELSRGEVLVIPAALRAEPGWARVLAPGGARWAWVGPAHETEEETA
jgi:mannose-6-phosphate isomerase